MLFLLAAAGCGTFSGPSAGSPSRAEAPDDAPHAQALARYAEGLLLETDHDRATDARHAFQEAAQLDPESRRPAGALVASLLREGRAPEALDRLEAYGETHPDDLDSRRDLARLAEMSNDAARAARAYQDAFRLEPNDLTLAFSQVRALFADNRDDEAIRTMRRLIRDRPCAETRNLPTFWALQFCQQAHTPARALPCIELAGASATGATQRAELRFFSGEAALAAGRTNAALRAFRQTLALCPQHVRAAMSLAGILCDRDGAAAVAEQAQRVGPDSNDVPELLILAALHLAAQDRTNAAPVLARVHDALLARQETPSVAFDLLRGATLDELGQTNAAIAVFEEALRRHPRASVLQNYLAYTWALAGVRLDEAASLAQQAVKLQPRNGAYLDTLGWVRYRQQRGTEALDLLLRARECLPDDPTVLDHVGDALAQLHRTPEAVAYWARSYAIDPAQPAVAAKLRSAGVNPASIPRVEPRPEPPGVEDESADEE